MSVAYTVSASSYVILGCKFTYYYRNFRQDIANFNFVKHSHDLTNHVSVLALAAPSSFHRFPDNNGFEYLSAKKKKKSRC